MRSMRLVAPMLVHVPDEGQTCTKCFLVERHQLFCVVLPSASALSSARGSRGPSSQSAVNVGEPNRLLPVLGLDPHVLVTHERDREPDPPHAHLGGGWLAGV